MADADLRINWKRTGDNGTVEASAEMAGVVLAVRKVDILDPDDRDRFATEVCQGRAGIDIGAVRERLKDIAAEHLRLGSPAGQPKADPSFVNFVSFVGGSGGAQVEPNPWPDPLGESAFYGLAGDIVRAIDPHTESDPAAILLQTLVGFGNAVGRSAYYIADAAYHYANLYVVLVGRTSKGRKGSSWQNTFTLLKGVDPEWAEHCAASGLSSGEGLIWQVRDPITKQVPVKVKGRFTGEYDEVIEDHGVADKRLLVQEGEFANVLKVMQREGNTLSPVLRLAWDTGTLRSMVKNSPARATGAHVSIVGHVTKDELRRDLDKTEAANGFGNRFLWVCVQRSKKLPDGGRIHTVDFSDIQRRLGEALSNAKEATLITRDGEARDLWHAVYSDLSEGAPGMVGGLTSRAEAQVMRLACVYALLDVCRVVRRPHLEAALAVWDYCEASTRYVFGSSLGDPVADEIYRLLCTRPQGLTRTDISRHFGNNREGAQVGRALVLLADQGKARMQTEKTGGRWFAVLRGNERNEINEKSTPVAEPPPAQPGGSEGEQPEDRYEADERAAIQTPGM